jgi:anhydro-N-acetylmuramic acid kinase
LTGASGALHAGLMSGTSLDGVDVVLADVHSQPPRLVASHYLPYPPAIRAEALALNRPCEGELERAWALGGQLAELYARAVGEVLAQAGISPDRVSALGCHGQTVRHRPDAGYTIQLVNGARLAELTGITTITDFRSRDIAAGGQGAPLVPAFHQACLARTDRHRVVVNLGGIANLTDLPRHGAIIGFDTGPGNLLLDLWAADHLGTSRDESGRFAASGRVDEGLLARCLADPFFERAPPRSTGRDDFHRDWLDARGITGIPAADVQATLAELTAASVSGAILRHCERATDPVDEVLLCGGGVHNADLVARIARRLAPRSVQSTAAVGVDPDQLEAFAFAWLAAQALAGKAGNLPSVTGARGPRVLGAIHPA